MGEGGDMLYAKTSWGHTKITYCELDETQDGQKYAKRPKMTELPKEDPAEPNNGVTSHGRGYARVSGEGWGRRGD